MADFKQFRPEWVTPISLDYKGTRVYETPPNSMGATSLLILNLLLSDGLSGTGPLSKERIQRTMRAVIPAYARRDEVLGDPRFSPFDLSTFLQLPKATRARTQRVNPGDTTAFSIADSAGNLVSCIQSLFNQFGSRVFIPECGIMMNNRGAGFSISGPNKVEPRKRPLNTLSSMVLERGGGPLVAAGTSGGEYRPLQHALFVTNAVDYAMGLEQNVGHPRFLWGGGRSLLVEAGYELPSGKDFEVQSVPMPGQTGVCQAVEASDGYRTAVCDLRGDGIPKGF
jgi:gamma-glutamyltranspeptidase/glutathione hydrolase